MSDPELKIGFLGAGNMARAIAGGMLGSKTATPHQLYASARTDKGCTEAQKMGMCTTLDNIKIVSTCKVVFLAVKPHVLSAVLAQVAPFLTPDHLLISVVNATTNEQIEAMCGGAKVPVLRTLPNTPVQVMSGVVVAYPGTHCTEEHTALGRQLLEPLGLFTVLPSEALMDVASGLCGSSPAFMYMIIDAMADAGVRMGLPRGMAADLAAKAMEGSAKMVLESGEHPIQLANNVCSPGGSTIEGVYRLNRAGMRGTVMDAVIGSIEKTQGKEMKYNY